MPEVSASRILAACVLLVFGGCGSVPYSESEISFEAAQNAFKVGEYNAAVAQFTTAITAARDHFFTEAYIERGESYLKMALKGPAPGSPDQRGTHLMQALADCATVLDKADIPAGLRARALLLQGRTYRERNDAGQTEVSFRKVLEIQLEPEEIGSRLEAHRALGLLYLADAQEHGAAGEYETIEPERQEKYRKAQEQFSKGLEIDTLDEECNRGKGICLLSRGQKGQAVTFLTRSVEISDGVSKQNPYGHFYLGLAVEMQKGYMEVALDHYRKAVEQDRTQSITALYMHLVEILLVYDQGKLQEEQFGWFLDNMLAYAGDSREYWRRVKELADRLLQKSSDARNRRTANNARALASARVGGVGATSYDDAAPAIAEAVKVALELKDEPDFLTLLSRIFPNVPRKPEYLYGRALTLFRADLHAELEIFLREAATRDDPKVLSNPFYRKTQVLDGRNIVAGWKNRQTGPTMKSEEKLERYQMLGRARDAFQGYIQSQPEETEEVCEVYMDLGNVQELLEAYPAAYFAYSQATQQCEVGKAIDAAFEKIVDLHSKQRLLSEKDSVDAWSTLQNYNGTGQKIQTYVDATRKALNDEARLYCMGCGRKGSESDVLCLECGRKIGVLAKGPEKGAK